MHKTVKVVLQQVGTGFFVGKKDLLVLEEQDARGFRDSTTAVEYCIHHGIDDVEVVMRFPDPRYDIRLRPFTDSRWQGRTIIFTDEAERLARLHEEIAKRQAHTKNRVAEIESIHLEAKEWRKKYPFKPAQVRRSHPDKSAVSESQMA
jgi:hypothetical protein